MLLTVSFNILIKRLETLGIGCYIGRRYCGVFGYVQVTTTLSFSGKVILYYLSSIVYTNGMALIAIYNYIV